MEVLADGFGLLEGPSWDPEKGLLFADAERGGVHCLGHDGQIFTVAAHRRGIGGLVRHESGGIIVSGRNIAYKGPLSESTSVVLDRAPDRGVVGFNDITTDRQGRIYAGALGFLPTETELSGIGGSSKPAPLFLIERDGSVREVSSAIQLSNGMGFNPSGSLLYHADSGDQTVYVYDVAANGDLANRRPFASVTDGLPDGLAVDAAGHVWLAVAHGGTVIHYSPSGEIVGVIRFPTPMITSLCFGGRDMRSLYVVSGSDGAGRAHAGAIYRFRVEIPGLPVEVARVKISNRNAA